MLFSYPESTRLNRVLPKTTIYKNVAPSAKQRELLTQQVEKITWAHKLAPDTLNIKASADLAEIQVFHLRLKPQLQGIHESLLEYLDKAIPSALIFEVQGDAGVQMVACLKQLNPNGSVKCSPYLYGAVHSAEISAEQSAETKRQALPISRDFSHLQQQILATLLPYPLQVNESLTDAIERVQKLEKLAKEIQRLSAQLAKKPMQFNRRVELNKELKSVKREQAALLI